MDTAASSNLPLWVWFLLTTIGGAGAGSMFSRWGLGSSWPRAARHALRTAGLAIVFLAMLWPFTRPPFGMDFSDLSIAVVAAASFTLLRESEEPERRPVLLAAILGIALALSHRAAAFFFP